jgi:hypothetical protein
MMVTSQRRRKLQAAIQRKPLFGRTCMMKLKPDLQLSVATVQAIVDQAVSASAVAAISRIHGGEIAAVYEIAFVDASHPALVLKIYPDDLHWKMQKEVTVLGLIGDRLSVAVPRILLADNSKQLLDLNFTLMTRLDGTKLGLGGLEDVSLALTPSDGLRTTDFSSRSSLRGVEGDEAIQISPQLWIASLRSQ